MTILIDAWLERRDPLLRLWDADNHVVLVEWRGDRLRSLFEAGLLELDNIAESVWSLMQQTSSP